MIRSRIGLLAAWVLGFAGVLACTPQAKAEFFEFSSMVSITGFTSPSGSTINNNPNGITSSFTTPNGNQVILTALSSNPAVPRNNAGGLGTDIPPLNINANSNFGSEFISLDFKLTLTLTDYMGAFDANPALGPNPVSFTFDGTIAGQLGDFQSNLNLASFIPQQITAVVGGSAYTIEFRNFSSPGSDNDGRLTLHVTASAVPEPASATLMGLGGLSLLGMLRRRRATVVA